MVFISWIFLAKRGSLPRLAWYDWQYDLYRLMHGGRNDPHAVARVYATELVTLLALKAALLMPQNYAEGY
jgi:hypothetical protein